ncbi:MAG: hypothetical protein GX786_02955 [Clostridiales bacterium]|nr:hypothetical protein [Clostridiales bacterium]
MEAATSIWVRLIRHGRIVKQVTVPATFEDPFSAVEEAMKKLDLSNPLWIEKNQQEWDNFFQTRFFPDDFMEKVSFDRMEIEYINPSSPKRKSTDPRNAIDSSF